MIDCFSFDFWFVVRKEEKPPESRKRECFYTHYSGVREWWITETRLGDRLNSYFGNPGLGRLVNHDQSNVRILSNIAQWVMYFLSFSDSHYQIFLNKHPCIIYLPRIRRIHDLKIKATKQLHPELAPFQRFRTYLACLNEHLIKFKQCDWLPKALPSSRRKSEFGSTLHNFQTLLISFQPTLRSKSFCVGAKDIFISEYFPSTPAYLGACWDDLAVDDIVDRRGLGHEASDWWPDSKSFLDARLQIWEVLGFFICDWRRYCLWPYRGIDLRLKFWVCNWWSDDMKHRWSNGCSSCVGASNSTIVNTTVVVVFQGRLTFELEILTERLLYSAHALQRNPAYLVG